MLARFTFSVIVPKDGEKKMDLKDTLIVGKNNYCFMINKAHWPPISINIY